MKPITRTIFAGMLAVGVFVVALATGWLTADAGPPQQQSAEATASATEEPLPDFQPTEELPADSAVAFPTDI
jgi:hypothetical protein